MNNDQCTDGKVCKNGECVDNGNKCGNNGEYINGNCYCPNNETIETCTICGTSTGCQPIEKCDTNDDNCFFGNLYSCDEKSGLTKIQNLPYSDITNHTEVYRKLFESQICKLNQSVLNFLKEELKRGINHEIQEDPSILEFTTNGDNPAKWRVEYSVKNDEFTLFHEESTIKQCTTFEQTFTSEEFVSLDLCNNIFLNDSCIVTLIDQLNTDIISSVSYLPATHGGTGAKTIISLNNVKCSRGNTSKNTIMWSIE